MSRETLPEYVDLRRVAARKAVFQGTVPNRLMARLVDNGTGETRADLRFATDRGGRVVIRGEADTEVELRCERCLGPLKVALHADIQLVQVASESEAEALPEEFEPFLRNEDTVRTVDLIEDELILALPIVPRHAEGECEAALPEEAPEVEEQTERPNPFAALQQLKRNKD